MGSSPISFLMLTLFLNFIFTSIETCYLILDSIIHAYTMGFRDLFFNFWILLLLVLCYYNIAYAKKNLLNTNVKSISFFFLPLSSESLNLFTWFDMIFAILLLYTIYSIINKKSLIFSTINSYIEKALYFRLFLWLFFILPVSIYWVNSVLILFISIPLLSVTSTVIFLGCELPLCYIIVSYYYFFIWVLSSCFVFLNMVNIPLTRRLLDFINTFFLKTSLKEFIGNSAGSRVAKLTLAATVVPMVTGVTSLDAKATLEASRILTERGIFADSAEYQAKMELTKTELFKATIWGKAFSSFTSKK